MTGQDRRCDRHFVAIVGSVFAMLGRFGGRLLNSALGWATILLFGKVDGRRQTLMLLIALGSLAWVAALAGVLWPAVGTVLLAFVPLPDFVDEDLVRLAMLAIATLLPALIGVAASFVAEPSARARGSRALGGALRGYPFTLVLATTILVLALVALVRKVRSLARRWDEAHVPVIVQPGGYDRVLLDLQRVLGRTRHPVRPTPAPRLLSLPPRLLDAIAGRALGSLVPDRLALLRGEQLEVLVYPSDVAISGSRTAVAEARAAIAAQLTDSPAYLTTSAEAQRVEDELRAVEGDLQRGAPTSMLLDRLSDVDRSIARLIVPFDEWETVYRERLQVERDVRTQRGHAPGGPSTMVAPRSVRPLEWIAAGAATTLLVVDAALLLHQRLNPRPRSRATETPRPWEWFRASR